MPQADLFSANRKRLNARSDMEMESRRESKTRSPAAHKTGASVHGSSLSRHPSVHPLLQLQRMIGNRAVQRALREGELIQPGTRVERDSDRSVAQRIAAAAGHGSPLAAEVRERFEEALGIDLSSVRIHTDTEADQLARSINARAFASGREIFFRAGAYDPGSLKGMRLLAHETFHTIQQAVGPVSGTPAPGGLTVSQGSDAFEHAADRVAEYLTLNAPQGPVHQNAKPSTRKASNLPSRQEHLLPLQRSPEPGSNTGENPTPSPPLIAPKFNVDIEEVPLGAFLKTRFVTGDVKFKAEASAEIVGASGKSGTVTAGPIVGVTPPNIGFKGDIELAKSKVQKEVLAGWRVEEIKVKLTYELSKNKFDVSIGIEVPIANPQIPVLKGVVEGKVVIIGADWKKLAKSPDDVTVLGAKFGGGITGDVIIPYDDDYAIKVKVKATLTGTLKPNMAEIAAEMAKSAAKGAAQGAADATVGGGALAVDTAALSSAAAAVALPAAFAMLFGYELIQTAKASDAARRAVSAGIEAREKAKIAARGYATVLTGGSSRGDPGSVKAEEQIIDLMATTNASREQAIEKIKAARGNYTSIFKAEYMKMLNILYDTAVHTFDEASQSDWGIIEKLGEDWGFRGVYRSTLRVVLYTGADEVEGS